jgi:SAM-dependent methyltransferase
MSDRSFVKRRLLESLWEKDADYYRKAREHVSALASSGGEYDWLRSWLPSHGLALEVGCGDGVHFEVFARAGLEWFGCDLSRLAIGLAARRAAAGRPPRLAVADAEELPFADGSFDAVLAVSVLEHLPDPDRALAGMIATLAPAGRLLLLSPQYGGPLGASPSRTGGGGSRFVRRLVRAHGPGAEGTRLGWDRVEPAVLAGAPYEGDKDAVVEPELRSLVRFLTRRGLVVQDASSGLAWHTWRTGRMSAGQWIARSLLEPLGRARIRPYRDFGPLVAVCAERPAAA